MGEVKPITPREARQAMVTKVPDYMITAINELLAEKVRPVGRISVTLTMTEIGDRVRRALNVDQDVHIPGECWDFEPIFEKAGWKISCDSPGYNEKYDTNWTFTDKATSADSF